ncbi:1,4-dihydroxy-2-naphthoate octaprenyltransferase [Croceivirga thetidis]|uniref:1,4-dihydroxy-2-naphthoate octaprenyltransferase n=1 Tax=Croceivirga thetidis TaxID=2721623 RepID=A0ABX1GQB9_9FLAO|nr:1,4-dihydroxy-2-naphthoate octaprenyltransferase [Croceivirga thetidis]NKI32105.1 1,4-dihydroxy-2-naphthoate octaprenyltransferase [Croceivirga thetidis]
MNKILIWLKAARLRTLPLSLSGIIVGTAMANAKGFNDILVFILALSTTVAFQITSNFANDYGDGTKGTDDENRIGPKRVLQSGLLSKSALKIGILISITISLFLSVILLYSAFGNENFGLLIIFLLLAIGSIWAAIRYTVGKNPYGYQGLGDLFVFLFFGILAVVGAEFLFTKRVEWLTFLPAITIGLLSTAVLNLNNLRDHTQDKVHGKSTLVVKMGFRKGKVYHNLIVILAFLALICYHLLSQLSIESGFYFLAFLPIFIHLRKLNKISEPRKIDPELKKVALSTFLLSILFYFAVNYFY